VYPSHRFDDGSVYSQIIYVRTLDTARLRAALETDKALTALNFLSGDELNTEV
jgi:hypothetical protein